VPLLPQRLEGLAAPEEGQAEAGHSVRRPIEVPEEERSRRARLSLKTSQRRTMRASSAVWAMLDRSR